MSKITIYSTATCGYCKMLKGYLQSKNIAYQEKHVDQDPQAAKELLDKSGQMSVPLSVIVQDDGSEEMILGFDRSRVDALMRAS